MDRLSSCYFCGGSLDASLAEYPVVPKALQSADNEGPTVVLCSTCRRKLGAVVEEVVAAAEPDSTAVTREESAETGAAAAAEPTAGSLLDDSAHGESASDAATTAAGDAVDSPERDRRVDGSDPDDPTPAARDGESEATAEASGASDDGTEPTLTKLEYNKVMRLLQNRPFPVDRREICEVATSAYEIDQQEFDAVIEAAVERDLIAVENGQFVEPE